jgi:transposase-like protein
MLNARQIYAVDLLSRSVSKKEVAAQVGVNRGTIYNWLEQPEFQHEINQRRQSLQQMLNDPTPYLTGLLHWQSTLPEVMRSVVKVASNPDHKNQLRAAELILEHLRPEHIEQAPSKDATVIAEYATKHGWGQRGVA